MSEGAINITIGGFMNDADIARKMDNFLQVMVSRPKGKRHDVDFYRRVARAYVRAKHQAGSPAKVMAEANHVSMSTIYRWVKGARSRGLLPVDAHIWTMPKRCPTCGHIVVEPEG